MPPQHTHVVDAGAVIAYFRGETGQDVFAALLGDEANVLATHSVNLCEVYYLYHRLDGYGRAEEAWEKANSIVAVLDRLTPQFVKRVGRWKVEQGLGLADAFAAATAEEYGCPLVTTDHNDFDEIHATGALQIIWLR